MQMNDRLLCGWGIFTLLFFLSIPAHAEDASALRLSSETVQQESSPSPEPTIDFESYRRDIDDLFQIAMMRGPSVDRGINSTIVDLNRKIAEKPEDAGPYVSLGHVYRILGQPREANLFYEKALALNPGDFHLNLFSAMMDAQELDYNKALAAIDAALKVHPMDLFAQISRGRVLSLLGRYQEAVDVFQKVLDVEPENRQALAAQALLYPKIGKPEESVRILEAIRKREPEDVFVRFNLGALYFQTGKASQGLEVWEDLFRDGFRDPSFLFNLAAAFRESGKPDQSKALLEHLHFFFPREPDVELMLAESYRQMNRSKEAERQYRLVIAEYPNYLSAYMGLAHLLGGEGRPEERDEILQQAFDRSRALADLKAEKEKMEAEQKMNMEGILSMLPSESR